MRMIWTLVAGSLVLLSACATHRYQDDGPEGVIYVEEAPPPPPRVVVVRPACPSPDYIWVEGYYERRGSRYGWVEPRWVRPPSRGAAWRPGYHHVDPRGRRVWTRGRWR